MTAPNMETITASLERSLQNCSLNHHHHHHHQSSSSGSNSGGEGAGDGFGRSSTSDSPENHHLSDTTLDLNSQISLPYNWEQRLDLKTGEVYYINRSTGMKSKEDPRTNGDLFSEDDSSYDSEESSSQSSSTDQHSHQNHRDDEKDSVLVVTGCKRCLMYFMVPKQVEDCPKCSGQLLHFDRSDNVSP